MHVFCSPLRSKSRKYAHFSSFYEPELSLLFKPGSSDWCLRQTRIEVQGACLQKIHECAVVDGCRPYSGK